MNPTVRAKFKVSEIRISTGTRPKTPAANEWEPCEVRTIVLVPVYANSDPAHENSQFWYASPSGKIELGCVNLAAAEKFVLDREYYIDFTPAPTPAN